MNKHQEALDGSVNIKENFIYHEGKMVQIKNVQNSKTLQELADKATPKKLIKLEITELDKIIMPEYTNTIDKYMCDECGLTWFIVDEHTCQNKFCKQCGQAILWKK